MSPADVALVLLSAALHASWNFLAKGSPSPRAFMLWNAGLSAALFPLAWPLCDPALLGPEVRGLLAATGVAHGLYYYWLARAYETGLLTVVYPIARSAPAVVPLVAVPLLGERLTPVGVAGIGAVLAGIFLLGGGFDARALRRRGAGYALLVLLGSVAYSVLDKAAMARLAAGRWEGALPPAAAYYLALCAASFPVYAALAARGLDAGAALRPWREERAAVLGSVAAGFASYGLVLAALARAPVSYVVAVRQTSVAFALALGVARLGERPGAPALLGSALAAAGVAAVALGG